MVFEMAVIGLIAFKITGEKHVVVNGIGFGTRRSNTFAKGRTTHPARWNDPGHISVDRANE